jgi:transcriptional regulator with XRE-family HTH domain
MHIGQLLAAEREKKRLSQRDLGNRLGISQVTVSRMESDRDLAADEALRYLDEIESPYADKIRVYTQTKWDQFESAPPLDHPDLESLMDANSGLHQLSLLQERVPEAHFIRDELDLYRDSLVNAVRYLLPLTHTVGFIGSIGVGKTTAICAAANLLLEGKPVLDYGGGRTTICEVVINTGPGWGVIVEPLENDEVAVLVDDFCDYALSRAAKGNATSPEEVDDPDGGANILSTELTRCIRNMAGLVQKRDRVARTVTDEAIELARRSSSKEDLKLEVLARMNLRARTNREVWHSSMKDKAPLPWLKRQFTGINHGRNPAFSIPKRINVVIPHAVIGASPMNGVAALNVSVIDTKGIDQLAPRSDIGALLDDPRALCVVCSRFLDAPDETSRSVLRRAVESGLRERLSAETQLLVLDRLEEAESVNDFDGTQVDTRDDGRQVRLADIGDSLSQEPLHIDTLNTAFFNQREDSPSVLSEIIEGGLRRMRGVYAARIERVMAQVRVLELDLEEYQQSACYKNIGQAVQTWIRGAESLSFKLDQVSESLLESIVDKNTYAASVRASVNRRGSWYNLNYYFQLAYGARVDFVAAISPALKKLTALLENFKGRDDMTPARAFVDELLAYIIDEAGQLQEQAQLMSQAVFEEPLRESAELWKNSQERWGGGPGYKVDISHYAREWLTADDRTPLFKILEESMVKKWREFLGSVRARLSRALG